MKLMQFDIVLNVNVLTNTFVLKIFMFFLETVKMYYVSPFYKG